MSKNENRFGLSRCIPESIARTVRQRYGFGCVVCGSAIYDYEHFNPEFKNAKLHDSDGVILLCPTCHRKKGSFLGQKTLAEAAKLPHCKTMGFSHTDMDIDNLTVDVGLFIATQCIVPLDLKTKKFPKRAIWFEAAEEEEAPIRLNLLTNNESGTKLVWTDNNVWHGSTGNLDVKITFGAECSKIRVTKSDQIIIVDIEFFPPDKMNIYKF